MFQPFPDVMDSVRCLTIAGLILVAAAGHSGQALDAGVRENGHRTLLEKKWIHGSADCGLNTDPAIEVFRYDQSSYILRQNKCLSFEAPFIYVLIGQTKILVLDTGATESAADLPLYATVQSLVANRSQTEASTSGTSKEWLILHSHSHGDHHAGDAQFVGKPHVTLIDPNADATDGFFDFDDKPDGEATIDLGGRKLTVVPTPGHQEEAIAIYDHQTKWLLTGDTFYPGYIYVKHWNDYVDSISRLVSFSKRNEVSAVLGAHIEMTNRSSEFYPIGTLYQPDEASLVLSHEDMVALSSIIRKDKPQKETSDRYVIAPMNALQKLISNIARWIVQ